MSNLFHRVNLPFFLILNIVYSQLRCLFPGAMDNGPLGKRVNYGEKALKPALEGIKKMEEFNYPSSLGTETLGSKAAGLSEKYENIS